MRSKFLGAIVAFSLVGGFQGLSLAAEGQNAAYWQLADETVAVVNGEPILFTDVKLYMLLFGERSFKKALDKLIDIYVVAQYAESKGLTIPQAKINEIVKTFAQKQGMTVEQLYKLLENEGLGGTVFQNFLYKYNLYAASLNFFVLKPLHKNKAELESLIAAYSPKAKPYYTLEILKIPLEVAEKNTDLLASLNFEKISKVLGIKPITLSAAADELSPHVAETVGRLKRGQVDFVQENGYILMVKVLNKTYKVPPADRKAIVAKIEAEKIKAFIEKLRGEAVIKILDESPRVYLPKGG